MKTSPILALVIAVVILAVGFWFMKSKPVETPVPVPNTEEGILSFEDCVEAGLPVTGTSPRQCKTTDGRTYAEEVPEVITYVNATANNIKVELPFPGAVTGKEFSVVGAARGGWYFEASFPIAVLDENDVLIATGIAQAQGEWMTENFVPFKADIVVPATFTGPATLVLRKDNPSGMPENDASISFPITIEY